MRFEILRPSAPLDIRNLELQSLIDKGETLPLFTECDLEEEAVEAVRDLYPDAIGMPVPLKIGSGQIVLLGILPSIHVPHDSNDTIPFVLFVQAVPEHESDRKLLRKNKPFDRRKWKVPPAKPVDGVRSLRAELRATDLETPASVEVTIGRKDGHLVIHTELNGIAVSLTIDDPDFALEAPSELGGTLTARDG